MIDTPYHQKLRKKLVNGIRAKGITDQRVLEAVFSIPRHFFMRPDMEELAYEDRAFPIGAGQTISQPYTVAYQTQLLNVKPNHRVLEIGTGSAYQAAVLAFIAFEVFSIERQRSFFERNRSFQFLKEFDNLYLFYGDGYEGLPEYAPYDRILITAAAPFIPPKLVMQLKHGGMMVLPLGDNESQQMVRITKHEDDEIVQEYFDRFKFVPLLPGKND